MFSSSENRSGRFDSDGFSIHYHYNLQGNNLVLEGNIEGAWRVASLDIRLLLLDAEGRVTKRTLVFISGYRVLEISQEERAFSKVIALVPGTAGFSFSLTTEERMWKP